MKKDFLHIFLTTIFVCYDMKQYKTQTKPLSHEINQRKSVYLSVLHVPQEQSFFEAAGRQYFANAWRQKRAHVLTPRHIHPFHSLLGLSFLEHFIVI